mmetsp:Transcript_3719/g.15764  ORF Transcript_3719/g.15764 Transcript_3719/m.15764 type:complete len:202 (-) Transcript_3719:1609-2214(-)
MHLRLVHREELALHGSVLLCLRERLRVPSLRLALRRRNLVRGGGRRLHLIFALAAVRPRARLHRVVVVRDAAVRETGRGRLGRRARRGRVQHLAPSRALRARRRDARRRGGVAGNLDVVKGNARVARAAAGRRRRLGVARKRLKRPRRSVPPVREERLEPAELEPHPEPDAARQAPRARLREAPPRLDRRAHALDGGPRVV